MQSRSFLAQLRVLLFLSAVLSGCAGWGVECEVLPLIVIPYERLVQGDVEALSALKKALYETGIVGVRGVPGYREKIDLFVEKAREFTALPEEVKDTYAPNRKRGDLFLGYEKGKERFKRPDGKWVVDDLKVSYYAFVPETPPNIWPVEVDLKTAYQDLGNLMADVGKMVMEQIELIGPQTGIFLNDTPQVGRMLYYEKSGNTSFDNPYWCGAHVDHGVFTVLTPATYFKNGAIIEEPQEAGLFVKVGGCFKKVKADLDVMLFQVGEFGQLASNDAIKATEHCVRKASGSVERFALAIFFNAPLLTVLHSFSELTQDARYGGGPGDACSYQRWHEESFKRYLIKDSEGVSMGKLEN